MSHTQAIAEVETISAPLPPDRRRWLESAAGTLDARWMTDLLAALVEIPSPFGEEMAIAEFLAKTMAACGMAARVDPIDDRSANAIGTFGDGDGPSLLIFAPLDSPFSGREDEDVPWVGDTIPDHMRPRAVIGDGTVTGLSADNPKAHITSAIAAARAVMGVVPALGGRVTLAFGAGGAPANPRPGDDRPRTGHGRGCEHMLDNGLRADFAIIAKPGYAVAWEEVGLCWFRVRVRGTQTYVGRKHFLAYKNPIAEAAPVILALERWFDDYATRHRDGLVAPQGAVGAIRGGWPHKPAFVPAACDLFVDLRISPRTSPARAEAELQAALADIRAANPGLELDCETIVAIPGYGTDPRNWIIQSCIRAWEDTEGVSHRPFLDTSGQTEAVILRRYGIPTARFGLPAVMTASAERPKHTMGMVEVAGMLRFTRCLIYSIIDTCTRDRVDIGLSEGSAQ